MALKKWKAATGRLSLFRGAPASDQVERDGALDMGAKIVVPHLAAEVRQIDQRHRIGCPDTDHGARGQRQEALPGAQHGKGAEEPLAVDLDIPIGHDRGVAG